MEQRKKELLSGQLKKQADVLNSTTELTTVLPLIATADALLKAAREEKYSGDEDDIAAQYMSLAEETTMYFQKAGSEGNTNAEQIKAVEQRLRAQMERSENPVDAYRDWLREDRRVLDAMETASTRVENSEQKKVFSEDVLRKYASLTVKIEALLSQMDELIQQGAAAAAADAVNCKKRAEGWM